MIENDKPAWEFEHSVECNSACPAVWAFWTDVSNWERIEGEAVEFIRLDGPFEVGVRGVTKSPGQEPREWKIDKLDPERSATIQMSIDQAVFYSQITLEPRSTGGTRITQRMSLVGEVPAELLTGVKSFEETAPSGLKKLAQAIEASQRAKGG